MWCYCEWQAFHNFKQYPRYYWKEFSHLNQEHFISTSIFINFLICSLLIRPLPLPDMSINIFYLNPVSVGGKGAISEGAPLLQNFPFFNHYRHRVNAEISASASSIIIMWVPQAPQPVLVVNLLDDVTPSEIIFVNTCKDTRSEEITSELESTFLWRK